MSSSNKSTSPTAKQGIIPIRRVPLSDNSQLPADYSATPGGTLFSTTPGGTHIIYERDFLLQCRNSPLAKSPPANLVSIPGVTHPLNNSTHKTEGGADASPRRPHNNQKQNENEDAQFEMDM